MSFAFYSKGTLWLSAVTKVNLAAIDPSGNRKSEGEYLVRSDRLLDVSNIGDKKTLAFGIIRYPASCSNILKAMQTMSLTEIIDVIKEASAYGSSGFEGFFVAISSMGIPHFFHGGDGNCFSRSWSEDADPKTIHSGVCVNQDDKKLIDKVINATPLEALAFADRGQPVSAYVTYNYYTGKFTDPVTLTAKRREALLKSFIDKLSKVLINGESK